MFSKVNSFLGRLDIKLTIYYTFILLVISLTLCSFLYYRLEHNLLKQTDKLLRDELSEFAGDFKKFNYNIIQACESFEIDTLHRKYYPIYFRILTLEGNVRFESDNAKTISFPPFEHNKPPFFTHITPERSCPYRFHQKNVTLANGEEFTIQIATVTKLSRKILENYLENITIAIPIILILSIGCGLLVSRKTRKILENIIKVTNRITSNNLQERLPLPQARDEVKDLTLTINYMMDRLEKAFKEIKQFTSDVSHELRNPLFALRGEMELAITEKRNDMEYRETIQECLERINFLIRMINDLFLISRFELKKMDLDLSYLNLGEILIDLFDFFLPMAQEKNLSFTIDRCDKVLINGDKTRIHQLLSNLLDNAIKFTPENGFVTLSLITKNGSAQFIAKDSGIGIPEADIPHIFKRFYQVDKSRSALSTGTGLGLHICKKIAEAHRGSITVEKNKDKGVTFIVNLPKAG